MVSSTLFAIYCYGSLEELSSKAYEKDNRDGDIISALANLEANPKTTVREMEVEFGVSKKLV